MSDYCSERGGPNEKELTEGGKAQLLYCPKLPTRRNIPFFSSTMLLPFITAAVILAAFSSAQASVPVCLTSCIAQFCTDITHLNCVCLEHASDIQNCVAGSCNTADQTLSQQTLGQNCCILGPLLLLSCSNC